MEDVAAAHDDADGGRRLDLARGIERTLARLSFLSPLPVVAACRTKAGASARSARP
jgi:hypothetical protein